MKNILLFFIKVIGLVWVYPCIPFRSYARNVVYNYVLNRDKRQWLSRLWQREPMLEPYYEGHALYGSKVHPVPMDGFVHSRNVSTIEFYFVVFFIWGWLDDDSEHDTTSLPHIQTCIDGERKDQLLSKLFKKQLKKIDQGAVVYGNAFDLGDVRDTHYPFYNFAATVIWNTRNTGMNFQYLFTNY